MYLFYDLIIYFRFMINLLKQVTNYKRVFQLGHLAALY